MANKLPWFTHDHDAHDDEFIQRSIDRFGHFGYAAYFITLELIHKHGVNGVLTIRASRYASLMRSRMDVVKDWLSFSGSFGKLSWEASGIDLVIENKKFIERQRKMKSKALSMLHQSSSNAPREGEEEREGDIDNVLPADKPQAASKTPKPRPKKDPTQQPPHVRVILAYKVAKGVDKNDPAWDRANMGRYSRAAVSILERFKGDVDAAAVYIIGQGEHLTSIGKSWNLNTINSHAWDNMGMEESTQEKNEHGRNSIALGADRLDGSRSTRRTSSSREITGDALRALESSTLHPEKHGGMAGNPNDPGFEPGF